MFFRYFDFHANVVIHARDRVFWGFELLSGDRALRRAENIAAQAPHRGQRHSMTSANRSAARRHWSRLTSRWVTARTVRSPKADTCTPVSSARATIVAASGALSSIRKITMLLWTVARWRQTPRRPASRSASSLALA